MRWFMAIVLVALGAKAADTASLIAQLDDKRPAIRQKAVESLQKLGPAAAEAVPKLEDCVSGDPDHGIRVRAVRALGAIHDFHAVPFLELIQQLPAAPGALKAAAKESINRIGLLTMEQSRWTQHCREYVAVNGEAVKITPIKPGYANSRYLTFDQAKREMQTKGVRDFHNVPQWTNPVAVTNYASEIPEARPGEFGMEPLSKVVQVLGPHEMLIDVPLFPGIQFEGAEHRTIRLLGYSTNGIVDGQWLPGRDKPFAIVGTSTYGDVSGAARTVLLAVPLESAVRGISFEDFERLVPSSEKHP